MKDFGYKTSNTAFSIGTTFEQYENLYFSPEISTAYEKLTTSSNASTFLKKQEGSYTDIYFNHALNYDLRNQRYQTTEGFRNTFQQDIPLISENMEIINSFQSTFYRKLFLSSDMIGRATFYAKMANSLNNSDVRISKRLYVPENKLRGFESGKIGPIDNKDFIGGNYVSTINLSSSLPQLLPSLEFLDFSIFYDAANIWGVDYDSSIDDSSAVRSSTGLALDVLTPIGPLNFSFSQVITKKSTDKTQAFRFNLGTTF